jgi:hypothetical protein
MKKYSIILPALLFLASSAWSQDNKAGDDPVDKVEAPEVAENEPAADSEVIDDADLDLQTYEEDDDDFVPTEEIPADEPIPFPSNI